MSSHRSIAQLAAGAALCTTSLAAAGSNPLAYATVNSWSVSVTLNGTDTGTGASSTSTTNLQTLLTGLSGFVGSALAFNYGIQGGNTYDSFGLKALAANPSTTITSSSAVMTFSVTFTRAATFYDLAAFAPPGGAPNTSWTANSNALSNGDVLTAGTYTFSGSGSWSGAPLSQAGYGFFLSYSTGGGGGVPLPGAAGLAACGLVGLSRRRRR
jgi:hypothetical protein